MAAGFPSGGLVEGAQVLFDLSEDGAMPGAML
jgi:hypothetical protein